ncbi:MAG TPA: heavy metal-associated domain-containing protein [Fimbriimonadaceae bacterium]|jgi:copper chaperone|nr:heavy metal-associated domain-containing protein [Fimbriimonadaceae bacterium]
MNNESTSSLTLSIQGMSCGHCKATVTEALQSVQGVVSVDMDLEEGKAVVSGDNLDTEAVVQAVTAEGFRAKAL